MKSIVFSLLSLILGAAPLSAQSINLLGIVEKPSKKTPVEVNLGPTGGYITYDYTYRSGCIGGYKVKVTFSKALNLLQPGETFQATLNCEDCSTPCGYKWKIVDFFDAGGVTSIDQYPTYQYNENLKILNSSNGASGVADHTPGRITTTFTVKYEPKKEVPLTALKIIAAFDHEVYYVFGQEAGASPSNPRSGGLMEGIWNGWGTMTLTASPQGYRGTYSDTYVKSERGLITLSRDRNGAWSGTWSEPSIGRSGTLYAVQISADGKNISGKYDVIQTGGKGSSTSGRSFSWSYRSPAVKR